MNIKTIIGASGSDSTTLAGSEYADSFTVNNDNCFDKNLHNHVGISFEHLTIVFAYLESFLAPLYVMKEALELKKGNCKESGIKVSSHPF